tara:strand:- start:21011 stop:22324 length:1314 start_codon:yes stop_codon:yes gene_type:complete
LPGQDEERRIESRRNLNLQVEYPDRQGYPIDVTESVSAGGIFIRSAQHHRVGEELRLAISLPGFPDTLQVRGVVSRIREATPGCPRGVALHFAEEEYVQRLTEIMSPAESRDFNLATGPYAVLAALPRIRLASTPTPLHRAERLSKALGGPDIWLKRDDLTGFALGGNEVRKMEFIVAEALHQRADTLVAAASSPNSSRARVMSSAAARLGLDSLVLVPPADRTKPRSSSYCDLLGAEVREAKSKHASPDTRVRQWVERLQADKRKPFGIGDAQNWLGACGYLLASIEMLIQMRRQRLAPQVLVTPIGCGETMSGLVLAQRWLDCSYDVLGVSIRHDEQWCTERVTTVASEVCSQLNIADTIPVDDIWVFDDYADAKKRHETEPKVQDAVSLVARHEGIFLDPDDSGIAMAGLIELIQRGELTKGQTVVFLHTGGPA